MQSMWNNTFVPSLFHYEALCPTKRMSRTYTSAFLSHHSHRSFIKYFKITQIPLFTVYRKYFFIYTRFLFDAVVIIIASNVSKPPKVRL